MKKELIDNIVEQHGKIEFWITCGAAFSVCLCLVMNLAAHFSGIGDFLVYQASIVLFCAFWSVCIAGLSIEAVKGANSVSKIAELRGTDDIGQIIESLDRFSSNLALVLGAFSLPAISLIGWTLMGLR